jgi:hypothetical protein
MLSTAPPMSKRNLRLQLVTLFRIMLLKLRTSHCFCVNACRLFGRTFDLALLAGESIAKDRQLQYSTKPYQSTFKISISAFSKCSD